MDFVFSWNSRNTLLKMVKGYVRDCSVKFINRMDSLWINVVTWGLIFIMGKKDEKIQSIYLGPTITQFWILCRFNSKCAHDSSLLRAGNSEFWALLCVYMSLTIYAWAYWAEDSLCELSYLFCQSIYLPPLTHFSHKRSRLLGVLLKSWISESHYFTQDA